MSKRLLYTEDSPKAFKLDDNNTVIKLAAYNTSDDINEPANLTNYDDLRLAIKNSHTYISSYTVHLTGSNEIEFSSSLLSSLPVDTYYLELWGTNKNSETVIYPDSEFLPLLINENAKGETGETITEISLEDAVKTLNKRIDDRLAEAKGAKGDTGASAYDIWKQTGHSGSVEDFLNSLKGIQGPQGIQGEQGPSGKPGPAGKDGAQGVQGNPGPAGKPGDSAYDIWKQAGHSGTVDEFLQSLQGKQGQPGEQGRPGESAYQTAVNSGFTGSVQEWLKSLQGPQGIQGERGPAGRDGQPGQPGKDGHDGVTGPQGPRGEQGPAGKPAQISKVFKSVADLNSDHGEGLTSGDFVLIADSTNDNSSENGRLYRWDGSKYDYLFDIRGQAGVQGPAGPAGANGKDGQPGKDGVDGHNGYSAYELAVNAGYKGTLNQWLDSLHGKNGEQGPAGKDGADGQPGAKGDPGQNGKDGKSAYQIWLDNGHSGTEQDFLLSLKGKTGDQGPRGLQGQKGDPGPAGHDGSQGIQGNPGQNGKDGKSAYQIWLDNGHSGTEQDFLLSLKGKTGEQGPAGSNGTNGQDGKSAYQIWINSGHYGTEQDFLASLRGPQGSAGINGTDGKPGKDGLNGTNATSNIISSTALTFPQFFDNSTFSVNTYPDPRKDFSKTIVFGPNTSLYQTVISASGLNASPMTSDNGDWACAVTINVNKGYDLDEAINWSYPFFAVGSVTISSIVVVAGSESSYTIYGGFSHLVAGMVLTPNDYRATSYDYKPLFNYITLSNVSRVDYTDLATGVSYNSAPLSTLSYVLYHNHFTYKQTGPASYDLTVSANEVKSSDYIYTYTVGYRGKLPVATQQGGFIEHDVIYGSSVTESGYNQNIFQAPVPLTGGYEFASVNVKSE